MPAAVSTEVKSAMMNTVERFISEAILATSLAKTTLTQEARRHRKMPMRKPRRPSRKTHLNPPATAKTKLIESIHLPESCKFRHFPKAVGSTSVRLAPHTALLGAGDCLCAF